MNFSIVHVTARHIYCMCCRWYTEVSQLPSSQTDKLPLFSHFPSGLCLFLADRLSHITCYMNTPLCDNAIVLLVLPKAWCCLGAALAVIRSGVTAYSSQRSQQMAELNTSPPEPSREIVAWIISKLQVAAVACRHWGAVSLCSRPWGYITRTPRGVTGGAHA